MVEFANSCFSGKLNYLFIYFLNVFFGTLCIMYFARYYLWIDDKSKKSRVSSPQYVDFVMTFVQKTVNDETLFPTKEKEYNTTS